jgi:hypothetical protein
MSPQTSNSQPPDFNAIYFDTNALLAAGWPDPSVLLNNVFVIGGWCEIQMFLPEPVVREAEEHWLRNVDERVARAHGTIKDLQRVAKPALCDARAEHPPIKVLHQQYVAKRDEVIAKYAISISPFTKRGVEDIFELATKYVLPFEHDREGKGFQDAVILASILEHLSAHTDPSSKAVFITKDEAFKKSNFKDFIDGFDSNRLRIVDLDAVWEELFHPYFDKTVLKPWDEERQNALAAAKAICPELEDFLMSHLSKSMLKSSWSATVEELLSVNAVRVSSVDTPIPDNRSSADRAVEFTIAVFANCTATVRKNSNLFLRALLGISEENVNTQPAPPEEEERVFWSGGIRATADVVNRQFQNIALQSLVSEEELRTKH